MSFEYKENYVLEQFGRKGYAGKANFSFLEKLETMDEHISSFSVKYNGEKFIGFFYQGESFVGFEKIKLQWKNMCFLWDVFQKPKERKFLLEPVCFGLMDENGIFVLAKYTEGSSLCSVFEKEFNREKTSQEICFISKALNTKRIFLPFHSRNFFVSSNTKIFCCFSMIERAEVWMNSRIPPELNPKWKHGRIWDLGFFLFSIFIGQPHTEKITLDEEIIKKVLECSELWTARAIENCLEISPKKRKIL